MALSFTNVTYTFYNSTLGRSVVPDEATFAKYALENKLYVQNMYDDGLIRERAADGIDSAVCMMIEVDYEAAQVAAGETAPDTSESIGGYSHSMDTKAYDKYIEQNMASVSSQKHKWLDLFCYILPGVK